MKTFRVQRQWVGFMLVFCLAVLVCTPWGPTVVSAKEASSPNPSLQALTSAQSLSYQWHTFYGIDAYTNIFYAVAVDRFGNTYAAGYADHAWGSPLRAYSGGYDIVVIKLNSRGVYQWHTYYGAAPTDLANGDDEANGLAVDADGNVFITGYSDTSWNVGAQAPRHAHDGIGQNMFLLKLNGSGAYQWHTFYQSGRANAIALDSSRNIYITGYSNSEFPGAVHSTAGSGHLVVLKFTSGGDLLWHTYFGAGVDAGDEAGYSIATDSAGNVILAGTATHSWQGGSNDNIDPRNPFSGGEGFSTDFVVMKFTSSGTYQWHTFYGASETDDHPYSLATSGTNIYVAGYSYATWGSPLHAHATEEDIAALKLNANGQLAWNTFYGTNGEDYGMGICADASGNVYVAGYSRGPGRRQRAGSQARLQRLWRKRYCGAEIELQRCLSAAHILWRRRCQRLCLWNGC